MSRRTARVSELLRDEISALLLREVKDPRISGLVSIVSIDVSPDLRQARVFVSVLGTSEEQEATLRGLRAAEGFLRGQLGERLKMRRIPALHFEQDRSIEQGSRILRIMAELDETGPRSDGSGGDRGPEPTSR